MNKIFEVTNKLFFKDNFLRPYFRNTRVFNETKKDVQQFYKKNILINLNDDLRKLFESLQGGIEQEILLEIEKYTENFVIMARLLQHLRKQRFLKFFIKVTPAFIFKIKADSLKNIYLSGISPNHTDLDIDIIGLKESDHFKMLIQLLKVSKYPERDFLLLWLQDLFIKHGPKNYHRDFSFTLKKFEFYFPELFPRKIFHGSEYENEFKNTMNKVRKRYQSH